MIVLLVNKDMEVRYSLVDSSFNLSSNKYMEGRYSLVHLAGILDGQQYNITIF